MQMYNQQAIIPTLQATVLQDLNQAQYCIHWTHAQQAAVDNERVRDSDPMPLNCKVKMQSVKASLIEKMVLTEFIVLRDMVNGIFMILKWRQGKP